MQNHMAIMDTITHMTRLILLLSVLVFPFLLPFLVFSFRPEDKDTGVANEEIWERDRRKSLSVTQSDSYAAHSQHHYSFVQIAEYHLVETIQSPLAAEIGAPASEERFMSHTNRVHVAIILTQDFFLYSIEMH